MARCTVRDFGGFQLGGDANIDSRIEAALKTLGDNASKVQLDSKHFEPAAKQPVPNRVLQQMVEEYQQQGKVSDYQQYFSCPITQEVMKDPVVAKDGFTYERSAVTQWVAKHGTSPMTRQALTMDFIPNVRLKSKIKDYSELLEKAVKQTYDEGHRVR